MIWNLFLAWLPVLFAYLFVRWQHKGGRPWLAGVWALLWLLFLPNSFYVLSDLIHLKWTGEINVLFDGVMFFSFILNSFIAGYLSVYMMHQEMLKWMRSRWAVAVLGVVFFLSGFAVYLGRSLRWNSWDVVSNPAGILFDVSDGIVNPLAHPQILLTTMTFFLLTSVTYAVIYEFVRTLQQK